MVLLYGWFFFFLPFFSSKKWKIWARSGFNVAPASTKPFTLFVFIPTLQLTSVPFYLSICFQFLVLHFYACLSSDSSLYAFCMFTIQNMSIRKWMCENNSGKLQKNTTTTTTNHNWAHERQMFMWRAKGWCGKNLIKVRVYAFFSVSFYSIFQFYLIRFWMSDSHVILSHIQFNSFFNRS